MGRSFSVFAALALLAAIRGDAQTAAPTCFPANHAVHVNPDFWEYKSTDLDGHPIDTAQHHPVSRQLTKPQDAQIVANYSDPAYVLDGWTPEVGR